MGPPRARSRRHPLHRPARPLRRDTGSLRSRQPGVQRGREGPLGMVHPHRRRGEGPRRRSGEPQAADWRDRGFRARYRDPRRGLRAAAHGVRRSGIPRGNPPALSLPRPAPRDHAGEHEAALRRGRFDPPPDVGQGLPRIPDADHHRLFARRRARLPRALAPASGQVLCPASGPAAVQTADHGLGLRQVFPDRPLLPRRRPPRRPQPDRFLSARHGDELCHPAGRVRHRLAGDRGHF